MHWRKWSDECSSKCIVITSIAAATNSIASIQSTIDGYGLSLFEIAPIVVVVVVVVTVVAIVAAIDLAPVVVLVAVESNETTSI